MANSHSAGRRMLRVRTGGAAPGGLSVVPSLADRMQASDRRNALLPQVTALHAALLKRLDLEKLRDVSDEDARGMVQDGAQAIIDGGAFPVAAGDRSRVISMVVNEVLGYGPLQELLDDPAISEIMVNGPDHIYVERDGRIAPSGVVFRDDAHIRRVAERILSAIGRRVDESSPLVDARLPDGSRVNITIPPATPFLHDHDPQVPQRPLCHAGSRGGRHPGRPDHALPRHLRGRETEHSDLRRHGQRENHHAQRHLGLHPSDGAGRDH